MSVKTKIIQSSASMRWELFEEISKQLDFYLSDKNIQCFNSCGDLNRFKGKKKRKELFKGYKGKEEICLRDFFYNLKQFGTPSEFGVVYVACLNGLLFSKKFKLNIKESRCLTICDLYNKYKKPLPQNFKDDCKPTSININNPLEVAIKLQILNPNEISDIQTIQTDKLKKGDFNINQISCPWNDPIMCRTSLWREIRATKLISLLLKYRICPNVPILYKVYLCDTCGVDSYNKVTLREEEIKEDKACVIIINELSDGDFKQWMKTPRSGLDWLSAYFQIFMGLVSMQLNFNMVHYDFHWGNQLWSKIEEDQTFAYHIYDTNNKFIQTFLIPMQGNLFKIWDLGAVKSDIGLGEDPHDIVNYRQNLGNGQFFNDALHILEAAISWGGYSGTVRAPYEIILWAYNVKKYIVNLNLKKVWVIIQMILYML